MKINIKTTNVELSDSVKDYLNKKIESLQRLLKGYADDEVIFDIEVSDSPKGGNFYRIEVNLRLKGEFLRVEAEKDDIYATIDEARDEMDEVLSSHKDKKQTIWKKGALQFKRMLKGFRSK